VQSLLFATTVVHDTNKIQYSRRFHECSIRSLKNVHFIRVVSIKTYNAIQNILWQFNSVVYIEIFSLKQID